MKVGIVGCGRISRAHVGALSAISELEIRGVCDQDRDRALEISTLAGGAGIYEDLGVMIQQEELDAIHILTPPTTHAELAIQAMEAGCHVLVEKPMAMNVTEAEEMIATAERTGVKLCVDHNYLFKPSIQKALSLVQSGVIGDVVFINTYYGLASETGAYASAAGRAQSAWRWRLHGGVFTDFLPHLIYLQLGFIDRIDRISGVTVLPRADSGKEASEMGIQYEGSGVLGTMTISMRAKPYAKFVDVYGTKGIVHADLAREVCTIHRERRLPGALSKLVFSLEASLQLAFGTIGTAVQVALGRMKRMPELRVLVQRFYKSIQDDTPPPVTGDQGKQVLAIVEKIWAQTPRDEPVATPPDDALDAQGPVTDAEKQFSDGIRDSTRVFVTGATGFLGQRLISTLARCGADVVALVRDESRVPEELKHKATFVRGDLRDLDDVVAAIQGASLVFHCAAVTTNAIPWQVHYDTNVTGTENVLQAAAKAGVVHVVHLSSVAVYGLDDRRRPVNELEALPKNPDRWAYYMRSKIEAEKVATTVAADNEFGLSIIRPGILYGPGAARAVGRGLVQLGSLRFTIGTGRNHLPYTYVDNTIDCMLLAAIHALPGVETYNVVDTPPLSVREAAKIDGRVRDESVRLVPVPAFLLSAAARIAEYRSRDVDTAPKLSRYVIRSAARDIVYDTQKARTQLGWQPAVSIEEGLRRMHGWRA